MQHPYQITALCGSQAFAPEGLLLAACGAKIISVKLSDGSIVSQWPEQKDGSSVSTLIWAPPTVAWLIGDPSQPRPSERMLNQVSGRSHFRWSSRQEAQT